MNCVIAWGATEGEEGGKPGIQKTRPGTTIWVPSNREGEKVLGRSKNRQSKIEGRRSERGKLRKEKTGHPR